MHRPLIGALSMVTAAAAIGLLSSPASARPPTRVVDTTAELACEATVGNAEVIVSVSRSQLLGATMANANVSVDGETVGEGETTSDWTDTSFRSAIPLTTRGGDPAGEIYFAGSYRPSSQSVTNESKFKVGNVHVVERHTSRVLELSDLALVYNGQALQITRCDGSLTDGYLSYTNPNVVISRESQLPYQCTSTRDLGLPYVGSETGGVNELFVDVMLDDEPEIGASGIVAASRGTWTGSLGVYQDGEEPGIVGATASLVKQRLTQSKDGEGTHFKVTPYDFTLKIAGGSRWAPATLQCTLYDIQVKHHDPNPAA